MADPAVDAVTSALGGRLAHVDVPAVVVELRRLGLSTAAIVAGADDLVEALTRMSEVDCG